MFLKFLEGVNLLGMVPKNMPRKKKYKNRKGIHSSWNAVKNQPGMKRSLAIRQRFADQRTAEAKWLEMEIQMLIDEAGGPKNLCPEQRQLLDMPIRFYLMKMHHFGNWLQEQTSLINDQGEPPAALGMFMKIEKRYQELVDRFRSLIKEERTEYERMLLAMGDSNAEKSQRGMEDQESPVGKDVSEGI